MQSGPPRAVEAIVAILIPPACREEVLGDLQERYVSPQQYGLDALRTVPLLIVSRIRRTADPQTVLMQASVLFASFVGAAWFEGGALLREQWGLPRLALPAGAALLGLMIADAYNRPARRSWLKSAGGPLFAIAWAFLSQWMLSASHRDLSIPGWIMCYGCALSLLLVSALRILFPPAFEQFQGANAAGYWLRRTGEPAGNRRGLIRGIIAVAAIALMATIIAYRFW